MGGFETHGSVGAMLRARTCEDTISGVAYAHSRPLSGIRLAALLTAGIRLCFFVEAAGIRLCLLTLGGAGVRLSCVRWMGR